MHIKIILILLATQPLIGDGLVEQDYQNSWIMLHAYHELSTNYMVLQTPELATFLQKQSGFHWMMHYGAYQYFPPTLV